MEMYNYLVINLKLETKKTKNMISMIDLDVFQKPEYQNVK